MDQEKIGKFISKCRKEKNLTQVDIANKLGISNKSISKWENGKCMPDLSLFNPLCEILGITVNDLMNGEKVDNKDYVSSLGENIINIVSDIEVKRKRRLKIFIYFIILILFLLFVCRCVYFYYEIDVRYDEKIMNCNISDDELNFNIKGQSVLNTYYIVKEIENEKIYFFHSTLNIYNKKRSNWEYSQSLIRLLDGKNIQFGYKHSIDIKDKNIKVYYTDNSIKSIKKANEVELKKIISNSYLMCEKN